MLVNLFIADYQDGDVCHVSALAYLLPKRLDVLERLQIGQIKDEYVSGGASQAIKPIIRPFVVAVDREIRDNRKIRYFYLVQPLIGYDRRVIGVLPVGGDVFLVEIVPHELLQTNVKS